ncbi:hypothetical protein GDO86_014079 [Hymenochirus boettgeri]|uniref:Tetraspanin n=1 Tax=Hymenochirus boettgeri TaxID=247094 RepID=A0A8T2JSM2_9PIPI|nr:hypothetical protein GDO86_014079 [Hymenochirus boettgeri]
MNVKVSRLFRKFFSRKGDEELDEFSSLLPKDDAGPCKTDNSEDYGGCQWDCLVPDSSPSTSLNNHNKDIIVLWIKYFMFFSNFLFLLLGFALFGFGVWGLLDKQSLISERIGYLSTDPMLSFILIGLIVSALSVSGCLGFIRENTCLLRFFSLGIITVMAMQVLSAIIILSFREQITNSVKSSMLVALSRYQDDSDLKFIMDEIQLGMECCGVQS